jgi:hypothetical protein
MSAVTKLHRPASAPNKKPTPALGHTDVLDLLHTRHQHVQVTLDLIFMATGGELVPKNLKNSIRATQDLLAPAPGKWEHIH